MTVCVQAHTFRSADDLCGTDGIDVVNHSELTCCPGFDELLSVFNPSPSAPLVLGMSQ